MIDWEPLQNRDFRRDPENPEKFARYEAEALIYRHLPLAGLLGLACYSPASKSIIDGHLAARGLDLKVVVQPGWFF